MKEHFIKKIKLQGPITISDYMSDCLLAPNNGYYNKENVIGTKGDFITSPEISQIFGELIGLAFIDYYYKCKKPNFPILVDLGGRNGTMMKDALRATKQIDKIQDVIKDKGINCIFSEPQFNPKIISTIAEDTNIKTGVFDPLGANINTDKSLYFTLINNLSRELKDC